MLNREQRDRKQSIVVARETLAVLPDLQAATEDAPRSISTEWVYRPTSRIFLRVLALVSLISVSANTPNTFQSIPLLAFLTFGTDVTIALIFTAEMLTKMKLKGIFKGPDAFFKQTWSKFDVAMIIFLWISVALHSFEVKYIAECANPLNIKDCVAIKTFWLNWGWLSILRCPRPLILLRVFRAVIQFQLPKTRLSAILQRSGKQVRNVTMFLLFFMALYGILGVQCFGESLKRHCVLNSTSDQNVTLSDLAIPDTRCSSDQSCPNNMRCVVINDAKNRETSYAGFDNFHMSFFTVYQAASQEGWVFIMYNTLDSLTSFNNWKSVVYFVSMIFFLAWLVKNVFIAVLIETFAEIRVQFQQMWTNPHAEADSDESKILQNDGQVWKLVPVDESQPKGYAPRVFLRIAKSTGFNVIVMLLVLANSFVAAGVHFNHDRVDRDQVNAASMTEFQVIENIFTILFDIEAVFKVLCFGWKGYWKRSLHKFELILCLFTSLRLIPSLYWTQLTYFQVLRIVRLIKASPMLEDFCFKIFGPVKKLGSLIVFTISLLVITSTISMQLFCFVSTTVTKDTTDMDGFSRFSTFHMAFMSMFQILTQKGWVAVMHDTMDSVQRSNLGRGPVVLTAIYFVIYHLFVTLIILSLFVAVILDNLELDEDIKKLKQRKMREISAETQQKLPMRLRIFEKFPNRPQMIKLGRLLSDFLLPRIRDSFMRQFAGADSAADELQYCEAMESLSPELKRKVRGLKGEEKRFAINFIVDESNRMRLEANCLDQVGIGGGGGIGQVSLLGAQHHLRQERRSTTVRNRHGPSAVGGGGGGGGGGGIVAGQTVANKVQPDKAVHFRENGEVVHMTSARRNDDYDIKMLQQKAQQAERLRSQQEADLRENHPFFDKPLFAVGRESQFRDFCQLLVDARYRGSGESELKSRGKGASKMLGMITYLDWTMITLSVFSITCMTFESLDNRVMNTTWLMTAEYIFFVAMTVEIILKVLANGFFFTPKALVRDFDGVLDLFIYLNSLVYVCYMLHVNTVQPGSLEQWLMVLRCLRPLRIFCLMPQLRRVVYELVRGFREIFMVSVLLFVFIFIFAIYGVHLFGGRLGICNDRSKRTRAECVGTFYRKVFVTKLNLDGEAPQILVPRVWANPRNFNFDTIGNALLALFEVLSLEGWVEVRDVIMNRVSPLHAVYIHLFVFIGCMIGLTLFVGVVVANYGENKGTALLTVDQRRWLDLKGRIKLTQPLRIPPRPNIVHGFRWEWMRARVYDITQHRLFKRFYALLIILNTLLLYLPWLDVLLVQRAQFNYSQAFTNCAVACTMLFMAEVALKCIALSFSGYWQSWRNRFDAVVTLAGFLWIILHFTAMIHDGSSLRSLSDDIGWLVVILRLFTITGKHPTLKMLMLTVLMSMFKSFFIILGMFLLMLVYALAGVILFGNVKNGENLNRQANFATCWRATVLLLRIVTGEDWNKIMHDCMIAPPFCKTQPDHNIWESDCGNSQASLVYFCSFYIIITYIMLNILVAIIMENFSLFYSNQEDALLSHTDIRHFQNTWNMLDESRKGTISLRKCKILLRLLKGRLEIDLEKPETKQLFKYMIYELEKQHGPGIYRFTMY
ncbi:hypothetical protein BOX15_Mlig020627g1 [Macrostomum lignano]|uniref:Ion transport domain-containing protein n=1 Tax=Macrostomum lignano TaxID=282301 RepID=A0A267F9S4_9PLAT|nr:hypothetical protein BOX15_Mlig020627g1 [Macrostomum lignano]